MKINIKNRQHIIKSTTAGLATQFVVPVVGAHRATSLTICTGDRSVDLNGRQIRVLREILSKSTELNRASAKTASAKTASVKTASVKTASAKTASAKTASAKL